MRLASPVAPGKPLKLVQIRGARHLIATGKTPRGPLVGSGDSRPVVLFVEGDRDRRDVYGGVLVYNGFNVLLAHDGQSAIRAVSVVRPDLIVLDLGLPDVDALEICGSLSRLPDGPPVPVVGLSAHRREEMEARALAAGCSVYIEKRGSTPVDVLHAIEGVIGRPPPPGEGTSSWLISYP